MTREFEDKHVVVTGGTGALGSAVVAALLDRGAVCHVPIHGDDNGKGFEHAERAELVTSVDLADEASASSFFGDLPPLWASIHVAGGFAFQPILETELADFEKMHRINALTCFLSCREAVRALRKHGGGGRIVNVSARPGVSGAANLVAYGASKAAVANMTEALAAELVGEDILVNAVLPSLIDTPANRAGMPDADFDAWPKPAEIAEAICFLASPRNRTTSGALLPVYGRS